MKNVLLPTDFSKNSLQGIKYTIGLYGLDAEYNLVHSVQPSHGKASVFVSLLGKLRRQSKRDLAYLESKIRDYVNDSALNLQTHSLHGELSEVIEEAVAKYQIDVIAMGTTGGDDIGTKIIGSNTFRVVRHTGCPIFIVPANTEIEKPDRIGLATDLSELERATLDHVIDFVKRMDATLDIINVSMSDDQKALQEEKIKLYDEAFKAVNHEFHFIEGDNMVEELNAYATENEVDMLVMVRQKHPLFERIFNPSTTRQMTLMSKVPLLIIHED